ncbi:MAG TPA: insulinase family protein, partial [Dehalococcoidia bacterium]|nr:insulinase family protein [Dehalococcoidia bacterium]
RFTLALLSIILGESMSSRLFLEVRERKALAYEINSYVTHFLDTGLFSVYAAVDPEKTAEVIPTILAQLAEVRDKGVSEEEMAKAREISKGRLLLRLEDTRSVSGWIGAQQLLTGEVRTVEDVIQSLEAVTREDLQRLASELFQQEQLFCAVVGPYRSEKRFLPLLSL